MTFVVDLLNASDVPIGDGPLQNVLSVSITESLDEVGSITFALPASDFRVATWLDTATRFRVKFSNARTAYGLISKDTIDPTANPPTRQVIGSDLLAELANRTMGWWCFYEGSDLNDVVLPELIAGTGWSLGSIEAGLGNFHGRFDGDSRLSALIKIIEQTPGKHFRMGSALRTLDLGVAVVGSYSDSIRFTNVAHALRGQDANPDLVIIESLQITGDRGQIINRIFPFGMGSDDGNTYREKVKLFHLDRDDTTRWAGIQAKPGVRGAQTTITAVIAPTQYQVASTAGFIEWPIQQLMWCVDPADLTADMAFDFVVSTIDGPNNLTIRGSPGLPAEPPAGAKLLGNPALCLEAAAVSEAGTELREAVIIFNEIKLAGLDGGSWASAAKQLYDRAKRYLDTHQAQQVTYTLSALRVPDDLRAGQIVRVVYHGIAKREGIPYRWLDVDANLYVLKITRTFNADGSTNAMLDVSNVDAHGTDDSTVLYDTNFDNGSIKVAAY